MRSVWVSFILAAAFCLSAFGDAVDPEILVDTGGDATPLGFSGAPLTVGPNGGGIFVFQNDTGSPLSQIDLLLQYPVAPLPNGFMVQVTVPIGASRVSDTRFSGMDCHMVPSETFSCIELKISLLRGPLIGVGENFALDFNDSAHYTDADFALETPGAYTGGDVPDGIGSWLNTTGGLTPVSSVPEPADCAAVSMLSIGLVTVWNVRRRRGVSSQSRTSAPVLRSDI